MALIISPRQLVQRAQFYQQLGQLTSAGVSVISALEMLLRNPPSASFREPIRRMVTQLGHGETITESMRQLGLWVPAFDLALVKAGEHSGRLDQVFKLLAANYEERARLLRQVISDLAYPVFVFHFMIFMFPFIEWFAGRCSGLGYLFRTFGILIPLYMVIALGVLATQGSRGEQWRAFLERLFKPVPVLGAARHFLALSRLASALEALLNAGVTIIEAWELAATASGSPALQRVVLSWRPKLAVGGTPAESVRESSQFPELFANLYYSGEISGQLDDTLRRLSAYYQEEGTRKMRLVATWGPKLIYFGVAGIVAFKVINFYLGYFKELNQVMGK